MRATRRGSFALHLLFQADPVAQPCDAVLSGSWKRRYSSVQFAIAKIQLKFEAVRFRTCIVFGIQVARHMAGQFPSVKLGIVNPCLGT